MAFFPLNYLTCVKFYHQCDERAKYCFVLKCGSFLGTCTCNCNCTFFEYLYGKLIELEVLCVFNPGLSVGGQVNDDRTRGAALAAWHGVIVC